MDSVDEDPPSGRRSQRNSLHDPIWVPTVDKSEILFEQVLGKGSCGKVWKGQCRSKICAIKEIGFNHHKTLTGASLQEFQAEVAIMTQLRHPNILLFMGACYDPCLIITEYLSKGDLDSYLQSDTQMSNYSILIMGKEICEGMNWLHRSQPPIIHKDLKPANILLDENNHPKIADFGLSVVQETRNLTETNFVGSALWMAPESLLMQVYNEKVDVYAFSLVLWQLFTHNRYPYDIKQFLDPGELSYFVHDQKKRPDTSKLCDGITEILANGWGHSPDSRPSFKKLIRQLHGQCFSLCLHDDPDAILLWGKWPSQDSIPFNQFCAELYSIIGEKWKNGGMRAQRDQERLSCLKELLTDPSNPTLVTLQNFGKLLAGFGPLKSVNPKSSILNKIHETMKCEWFHGDISNDESTRMLTSHQHPGEYLIRTSTMDGYPFTIAKVSKKKTISLQRIGYNQKEYYIKISSSQVISNTNLVHLLDKHGKALGLSKICPRTKYREIFQSKLDFTGYQDLDQEGDQIILKDLADVYGHKYS